jgi:hypothetical protein
MKNVLSILVVLLGTLCSYGQNSDSTLTEEPMRMKFVQMTDSILETWLIMAVGEDATETEIRIMSREYFDSTRKNWIDYKDGFLLNANGELTIAYETEKFMFDGGYEPQETAVWSCSYTIDEGKIIDYKSMGHGKTETDEWEPESILEEWERRKPVYLKAIKGE